MSIFKRLFNKSESEKLTTSNGFGIQQMYLFNLKHLVSKIENEFNLIINSYGIESRGSAFYNQLSSNTPVGNYIGYLVVPVDEDGEYLVTKKSNKDYDYSNIMDRYAAHGAIIPTQDLIEFIQNEFKGRVYVRKRISFAEAPDKNRIMPNMEQSDHFLYLHYFID